VRGRALTLRAIAPVAAGSAAIHQARYALGGGGQQAAHAHEYLGVALPVVLAALVLALGAILMRVARGRPASSSRSLWVVWAVAAVALGTVFAVQESIEGAAVIAGGGWIGLALAVPAGLLVALLLRGAAVAEARPEPGPLLGFLAVMDAVPAMAAHVGDGRPAASAGGARAPPIAFVV
jgi:hypothetical protein